MLSPLSSAAKMTLPPMLPRKNWLRSTRPPPTGRMSAPTGPAEPILRFSPGTDSGTFDYFVEAIMGPANLDADGKADLAKGEEVLLNAANIQLSEDDNVLVQGVEGSPYAIGYFGYAYFQENQGNLKALSIGGDRTQCRNC